MRVLSFLDPNFKEMQTGLDIASYADHEKHLNMMKKLEKPFFLISEYIPGIYLHEIGKIRGEITLNASFPHSRDRLIRLGMMLAADSLINFQDRAPLIHNKSNSFNFLLKIETMWGKNEKEFKSPFNINE